MTEADFFECDLEHINMGKLVHIVSNQLKRRGDHFETENGLTHMQTHVLRYILLRSLKEEIYQKDIEDEFQIRRSTVTGILQLLEKKGFITRKSVAADGRLKQLIATQKAKILQERIQQDIACTEACMAQNISNEDYRICKRVLAQILRNLIEDAALQTSKKERSKT